MPIRRRDVDLFGRVPAETNAARPGAGLSTAPNKSNSVDALDPVLPLSPGRAERHGFEYYRHGTLSLYAALNTRTGEIIGQTVPRHTSDAFVDFLTDIVGTQPRRREIHVIVETSRRIRRRRSTPFSKRIPGSICTSRQPCVLAQSGRARVCQDRTGPARARHLYLAADLAPEESVATSRAISEAPNRSA